MKPLVDDLYNSADTKPDAHAGRAVFAVMAAIVGYHATLVRLVAPPFFAADGRTLALLLLAAAAACIQHSAVTEVSIHDRQVDWIIGIPLLSLAIALNASPVGGPSTTGGVRHVDLFSLPLFVAGITVLLFGVRALGRQHRTLALLVLAWPWPYQFATAHVFAGVPAAGAVVSFTVVAIAALVVARSSRYDAFSWRARGATHERLSCAFHYRPSARSAMCCTVIAAIVMAWLSRGGST